MSPILPLVVEGRNMLVCRHVSTFQSLTLVRWEDEESEKGGKRKDCVAFAIENNCLGEEGLPVPSGYSNVISLRGLRTAREAAIA